MNTTQMLIVVCLYVFSYLILYLLCKDLPYSIFYRVDMNKIHDFVNRSRNKSIEKLAKFKSYNQDKSKICIGVMTIKRPRGRDEYYLTQTIMSLVSKDSVNLAIYNLDSEDHAEAHTLSAFFPMYLLKTNITATNVFLKQAIGYINVARHLLERCKDDVIVIEDDAVATAGWMQSIDKIKEEATEKWGHQWMLIKLFAPLTWLGWSWDIKDVASLIIIGSTAAYIVELLISMTLPKNSLREWALFSRMKWTFLIMLYTLCFWGAGKQNLWYRPKGLFEMDNGAGLVAILWNRKHLLKFCDTIQARLNESIKPIDLYLTDYRLENRGVAILAYNPDLFQHIGLISSFEHKLEMTSQDLAWSFTFPGWNVAPH